MTEVWHRIEVTTHGHVDEWGDVVGSSDYERHTTFEVVKTTPKGAQLNAWGQRKFVLREMQHRGRAFAAPTLEQAREDFIARKTFRINRLQAQINRETRYIELIRYQQGRFSLKP